MLLLHVERGLSRCLLPWGSYLKAILAISWVGFLKVWPIQRHFRSKISTLICLELVSRHRCWFEIVSGQNIRHIFLRQELTNTCNSCVVFSDDFHVSEPYNRVDFTQLLKMRILVFLEIFLEPQTLRSLWKTTRALFMRALTSSSVPPSVETILPR